MFNNIRSRNVDLGHDLYSLELQKIQSCCHFAYVVFCVGTFRGNLFNSKPFVIQNLTFSQQSLY